MKILEASGIYTKSSPEFQRPPLTGISRCIKAEQHDAGVVEPTLYQRPRGNNNGGEILGGLSPTVTSSRWEQNVSLKTGGRIRKLIPLECLRLMGFDDDDFNKVKAVGVSDSQVYKQAGNSIVVNVLEAIFGQMF